MSLEAKRKNNQHRFCVGVELTHFESGDVEVSSMPEMVDPLRALSMSLTLCNLIVVMREFEIDAARVNVERRTKQIGRHGRALGTEQADKMARMSSQLDKHRNHAIYALLICGFLTSMCHPGRPLPQGESHSGSPCLLLFHSAKSMPLLRPSASPLSEPSPL